VRNVLLILTSPTHRRPLAGSADLIVFGKGCKGCNSSALFDMSKSTTNHEGTLVFHHWLLLDLCLIGSCTVGCHDPNLYCDHMYCWGFQCGFKLDFGDGSGASGEVCKDKVTVGGLKSKSTPFMGVIMDLKLPSGGEFEPVRHITFYFFMLALIRLGNRPELMDCGVWLSTSCRAGMAKQCSTTYTKTLTGIMDSPCALDRALERCH